MYLVIDSNVLISHLLSPASAPAEAVRQAFRHHTVLLSEPLLLELREVLERPKFDAYVSRKKRHEFLHRLVKITEPVQIIQRVKACRDQKDDMILELAVNGQADVIVTGDADLLAMHPFRGVRIMNPVDFLTNMVG